MPNDPTLPSRIRDLEGRFIRATRAAECLEILIELAQLHADASHNREGLRCAREALNIARVRGAEQAAGRALVAAARCHFQKEDFVSAVACGLEAVQAFGEDDRRGRSAALRRVVASMLAIEAHDLAAEFAERAVEDAELAEDAGGQAVARALWADVLCRRGQFKAARALLRQAAAAHRVLGDGLAAKQAVFALAEAYREEAQEAAARADAIVTRGFHRQAIRVHRVAIRMASSLFEDALGHAAIAECELALGNPRAALGAANHAIALAIESRSPAALARARLVESQALQALGRLDTARRACAAARDAAEQLARGDLLAQCLAAAAAIESAATPLGAAFDSQALQVRKERDARLSRLRAEVAQIKPGTFPFLG